MTQVPGSTRRHRSRQRCMSRGITNCIFSALPLLKSTADARLVRRTAIPSGVGRSLATWSLTRNDSEKRFSTVWEKDWWLSTRRVSRTGCSQLILPHISFMMRSVSCFSCSVIASLLTSSGLMHFPRGRFLDRCTVFLCFGCVSIGPFMVATPGTQWNSFEKLSPSRSQLNKWGWLSTISGGSSPGANWRRSFFTKVSGVTVLSLF
mmetsp:Transcript_43348/g.102813  ORF Transcript_43348/g.102813 Transcript_43348/m.102813 type:complete len:206 (-) Transcript_43348:360-977(-)